MASQKMPLENVKAPTKMPKTKSFILTEPPTVMMSPYTAGPVDRTDDESPLTLDAAKNQKFRMAAGAVEPTQVLEDPS